MSATCARAAAAFAVQRAVAYPGERDSGRLVRMQSEMDAIARGVKPCDFAYAYTGRDFPARRLKLQAA